MNAVIGKVEVSTQCECYACETCNMSYVGEGECYECDTALTPARYCDSICWEDANNMAEEIVEDYLKLMDNPKRLRIEGRRMGWQNLSGYADVKPTWAAIRDALWINGELKLTLKVEEGGIFTARRYSHDEPVGASFSIFPIQLLPDTMDLDEAIKLEIVDEYGCHKGCGDYFYDCQCEGEGAR